MIRESTASKRIHPEESLRYFYNGMTLMVGGFGGVGNPPTLLKGIVDKNIRDITLICNDTAFPDIGVGRLITNNQVKKVIASHIGSNPFAGDLMSKGKLEVEFSPQGTLAERIRAGGAGLGGILVDVGVNSMVADGKKRIQLNQITYLIETALTADVAIVYAKVADTYGNLIYDKTARNTNPLVATAGHFTIAEAEEIVQPGELNPDEIVTPGAFVDKIVKSEGVNWIWPWEKGFVKRLPNELPKKLKQE